MQKGKRKKRDDEVLPPVSKKKERSIRWKDENSDAALTTVRHIEKRGFRRTGRKHSSRDTRGVWKVDDKRASDPHTKGYLS